MPIVDINVRLRELGRIRTGNQVAGGNGKRRPNKLETFRLTSPSQALIDAAAELYGGTVAPWESPAGKQFELVTAVDVLPIVIPPGEPLSQWMELWKGGGCERRCDGRTEVLSDAPCLCPASSDQRRELANAGQACKPTTRLNVLLPDLPDLGVWRLESHGYYAAVELAGAAQFLAMASAAGMNIPANLRLDQREKKVPGKPTNRYAVPVIEFTTTRITDLLAAGAGPMMLGDAASSETPQLAPGMLAPTKTARQRQPKVDRPAIGPAPTLPDGSGFGRPQATPPAAPLPPTTAPEATQDAEPETVAGWVVDGDQAPPDAVWASAEPAAADPPAFDAAPITPAALAEWIGTLSTEDKQTARDVFTRRFPTAKNLADLEDEQLGRYRAEVETALADQPAAATA